MWSTSGLMFKFHILDFLILAFAHQVVLVYPSWHAIPHAAAF